MKLVKAIEIKEAYHKTYGKHMLSWEREADNMSIEALKRIQYVREHKVDRAGLPLPGETEE